MEPQVNNMEEIEYLTSIYKNGGWPAVASFLQDSQKEREKELLNIAVTGQSGAGKSTFINAIRGITDNDPSAAEVDVKETTMKPTPYCSDRFPNVTFWDLPGIGTTKFSASTYLHKICYQSYDFFIIVSFSRFSESDASLACEIKKLDKKFIFIRSKIDQDIVSYKRKMKTEEEAMEAVRSDCKNNLEKLGIAASQVFLISFWDIQRYEFTKMLEAIEKLLPVVKHEHFLLSLATRSKQVIDAKTKILKKRIVKIATLSCLFCGIPLPLASALCNLEVLTTEAKFYYRQYGLDDASLKALSVQSGKCVDELQCEITHKYLNEQGKLNILERLEEANGEASFIAYGILSFFSYFASIPAGVLSFKIVMAMLERLLDDLAADSWCVLKKAMGTEMQ
ncbi:interferon-inducible GTPase 5-like [Protopterus annectens]|uniref:interferon-inducible GTPase 5-like n=1 Tax=Protopterus annectens TaxID=7888 RepID=UPI001CFAF72A|nr:interferon-inducible GTPase 5-like [Protopterus annectens]